MKLRGNFNAISVNYYCVQKDATNHWKVNTHTQLITFATALIGHWNVNNSQSVDLPVVLACNDDVRQGDASRILCDETV